MRSETPYGGVARPAAFAVKRKKVSQTCAVFERQGKPYLSREFSVNDGEKLGGTARD